MTGFFSMIVMSKLESTSDMADAQDPSSTAWHFGLILPRVAFSCTQSTRTQYKVVIMIHALLGHLE